MAGYSVFGYLGPTASIWLFMTFLNNLWAEGLQNCNNPIWAHLNTQNLIRGFDRARASTWQVWDIFVDKCPKRPSFGFKFYEFKMEFRVGFGPGKNIFNQNKSWRPVNNENL